MYRGTVLVNGSRGSRLSYLRQVILEGGTLFLIASDPIYQLLVSRNTALNLLENTCFEKASGRPEKGLSEHIETL